MNPGSQNWTGMGIDIEWQGGTEPRFPDVNGAPWAVHMDTCFQPCGGTWGLARLDNKTNRKNESVQGQLPTGHHSSATQASLK
jgi:hypothetical protein